jgi:hypothetical protein
MTRKYTSGDPGARNGATIAPTSATTVTPNSECVIPCWRRIGHRFASGKKRASASGRPPAIAPAAR